MMTPPLRQTIDPIYVISKRRWAYPYTIRALQAIGAAFYLVVEPHEAEQYAPLVTPQQLLVLPFRDRGTSVPARNWVWDHAAASGASYHWILDDNITHFSVVWRSQKHYATDPAIFDDISRFARLFRNLAISGMQYESFVTRYQPADAIGFNMRVYSCILISHQLPFRWRGVYNEDTDLSLRALKAGWTTALWHVYLAKKLGTMRVPGGNTDTLYADRMRGRLRMAMSLQRQHPDVATVSWRWNRPQHKVDYRPFRNNRLLLADGVTEEDVRAFRPTEFRYWEDTHPWRDRLTQLGLTPSTSDTSLPTGGGAL